MGAATQTEKCSVLNRRSRGQGDWIEESHGLNGGKIDWH
jgi:hypothetical protein